MKTIYRIELKPIGGTDLTNELTLLAAWYNGGQSQNTLARIKSIADANILLYPHANKDTTVEMIGDNTLHVDIKTGDTYVTVLAINLVEVWETAKTLEEIDKEAAENVTLQRHLSQQGEQC